jgi:hypothetical protein
MPGQTVSRWPKDVARWLPAGARIVFRIHYHKNSEAVSSPGMLGLYFARDQRVKSLRTVILAAAEQVIPAGVEGYRVKASYTMRAAGQAIAIRPLLFRLNQLRNCQQPDGTIEA